MAHRSRSAGGNGQKKEILQKAIAAQKDAVERSRLSLATKFHLLEHGEGLAGIIAGRTPDQKFLKLAAFGLACLHSDYEKKPLTAERMAEKLGEALADSLTQREGVELLGTCLPGERDISAIIRMYGGRLEELRYGSRYLRELNAVTGKEPGDYSEALVEGVTAPLNNLEMAMHLGLDSRDPERLWSILGDSASDELAKFIIKYYANVAKSLHLHRLERRLLNMGVSRLYPDAYARVKEIMWERRIARQVAKSVLENVLRRGMKQIGGNKLLRKTEITSRIKWDARSAIKLVEKDELDWDTVGVRAEVSLPKQEVRELGNRLRGELFRICSVGGNRANNSTFWITGWDDHYGNDGAAAGIHINLTIETPEGKIGGEMQVRDSESGCRMREGEAADAHYQSRILAGENGEKKVEYALSREAFARIKAFRQEMAGHDATSNPLNKFRRHFLRVEHGSRTEKLSILLEQGALVVDAVHGTFGVEKAVMAGGNGMSLYDECPTTLQLRLLDEPKELGPRELRKLAESARERTNQVSLLELAKAREEREHRKRK